MSGASKVEDIMKLLSVAVGAPREVRWHDETVTTSIFKTPVQGRVAVGTINIAGDDQSDRTVHGGPYKAVYVYPSEHYPAWQRELGREALPWASFGENLTTEGLLESVVRIGDRYRIGSAECVVTQPRLPCFKLGIRFGQDDIIARFANVDRSGFYLRVERTGDLAAGDAIELLEQDPRILTVADTFRLKLGDWSRPLLDIAARHPSLPPEWREGFLKTLERLSIAPQVAHKMTSAP
jgi:MOSC domain-containing protein YiiM